ncbi:MAG: hypothetical protein MJK04_01650 [Psychrosphaera sp.]|nr:hypothetical protein [Psychrosphaera sp.]
MLNRPMIILLAILHCLMCATNASASQQWVFTDVDTGELIVLSKKYNYLAVADLTERVSFCSERDTIYCFSTKHFNFAVPKVLDDQLSWHHNGRVFCVAERFNSTADGTSSDSYLILSKQGKKCDGGYNQSAFYSKSQGLRLIRTLYDGISSTYLSTEQIGFAKKKNQ